MTRSEERLVDRWPVLAAQLRRTLAEEGEAALAEQVDSLVVHSMCPCGDDYCQSIRTVPNVSVTRASAKETRTLDLPAPWDGLLLVDVFDGKLGYIEVLDREPLD